VTQATLASELPIALKEHAPIRPKLDVGFDARTALIFFSVRVRAVLHRLRHYVDLTSPPGVRRLGLEALGDSLAKADALGSSPA
jgi:hypothetical protein